MARNRTGNHRPRPVTAMHPTTATSKRKTTCFRQACAAASLAAMLLAGCAANIGGGGAAPDLARNAPVPAPGGIGPSAPPGIAKPSVKIALLLPLSARGQAGPIAKGLKQAAEMALFEKNNPNVQLMVKDTKGTAEGAAAAATQAASDGAEIILGPLFASNVTAVTPIARQARLSVIAFSNDRRVAGNGTYLLSFLARDEVRRIVRYAVARGKQTFAALIPDNGYGKIVSQAFRQEVAAAGGRIAAIETYPPGTNGMLEPSQRLFEAVKGAAADGTPVDAIFLPGGPDTLPNIAPLVRYASVDPSQVKFLGSGGWDYPNIGRHKAFVGGWYPSPDPRGWRSFSERYIKAFGTAPPRIATLAYDAVTIAVTLAGTYPAGQRFTPSNLARAAGFNGLDGPVRFTAGGTAERALAVLEVQKFGSRVIDQAPSGPDSVGGPYAQRPFSNAGTVPRPPTSTGALPHGLPDR